MAKYTPQAGFDQYFFGNIYTKLQLFIEIFSIKDRHPTLQYSKINHYRLKTPMKENTRMTGTERTLRAINFEPVDRIPVVGGFVRHPEFLAEAAGTSVETFRRDPSRTALAAFRSLGVDTILGLILPNPDSPTGAQVEHKRQDRFHSPEDVVAHIRELPSPSKIEVDFREEYNAYCRLYQDGQAEIGDDILWIPNSFRYVAQFQNEGRFGPENYYMALALYPEEMRRWFEYSGEVAYLRNRALAAAIIENDYPRVMWLGQDACDNRGPYIAPHVMNDIYIRYVRRSLEPLKEAGITILWHADGNIVPIAQHLLDAGADGFQGVQETIDTKIDIHALMSMTTLTGKKPVIVGSISSITTMPFGTPDDVIEDTDRCIGIARKRGGGWLLNFSSSLGPEVPKENIYAFFRHATAKPPQSIPQSTGNAGEK
jgi:hypothetical protein